jgi:hypothetical protein
MHDDVGGAQAELTLALSGTMVACLPECEEEGIDCVVRED